MNVFMNNIRDNSITYFWRLSVIVAAGWFATDLIELFTHPNPNLTQIDLGRAIGYGLTLALFGIGDLAILNILTAMLRRKEQVEIHDLCTQYIFIDWVAIILQAFVLNLMAWSLFTFLDRFAYFACMLAGIDMVWLSIKLRQYDRAYDKLKNSNLGLARKIRMTKDVILNWVAINGIYSICVPLLFMMASSSGTNVDPENIVWLTVARSVADLLLCRKFYQDVLAGGYVFK